MKRGAVAAMLAVIMLLCGGARVAGAAGAVLPPDSPKESPWFSEVVHQSARGSRDLLGLPVDPSMVKREIQRLADRLRPEVSRAVDEDQIVDAFRRVLLIEEGFVYDKSSTDPGNYLLETVLARKKGNCLGLSMLYLSLADRLGLPFRGVYVPSHCFVRYEGKTTRRNVEFAERGANWKDEQYRKVFRIRPERPYLHTLTPPEMVGVFLKTLGAGYSRKGRDEEAIRLYDEAERLYPGLPDVHFNAGVSLQKLGRHDAAGGKYRRAIELDYEMAAARDNLSILLAGQGRYEEAIGEARMAVELEPWNAAARGNLAAAYCGCGMLDEGIREYRAAVKIDPASRRLRSGLERAYISLGSEREANP